MKKFWQMIGVGLLTASLTMITTVSAQHDLDTEVGARSTRRSDGPDRGHNPCHHRALRDLFSVLRAIEVTEGRQAQITALRDSSRDSFEAIRNNSQAVRQEVLDQLLVAGPLATDFAVESTQLGNYAQQRISQELTMLSEVRNILTDPQIAEAADLIESRQVLCNELQEMFPNPDENTGK